MTQRRDAVKLYLAFVCLMASTKLRIEKNSQNFSAVVSHYLKSSLPFGQKALFLHHTITCSSIIIP